MALGVTETQGLGPPGLNQEEHSSQRVVDALLPDTALNSKFSLQNLRRYVQAVFLKGIIFISSKIQQGFFLSS